MDCCDALDKHHKVEEMLRQKKYHESFLMQGGLRAMAA
jgi:hypothetical protein